MIAATARALVIGKKVAGLYDHVAARRPRMAAESRKDHQQGYDGGPGARFGGTLPEIRGATDVGQVQMMVQGTTASGHDRHSSGH